MLHYPLQKLLLGYFCDACVYSVVGQEGAEQGRWHLWQVKPITEGWCFKGSGCRRVGLRLEAGWERQLKGITPCGLAGSGLFAKAGGCVL